MSRKIIKYTKCKGCGEVNFIPEQTKDLKCYFCSKFEPKWNENQAREKQKKQVREMVEYLIPSGTPRVDFPISNNCDGDICPGWYTPAINTISIPQKTLYLPNDEIADTTAHETAHQPTFEVDKSHGSVWENQYNQFRGQLFSKYSTWINSPNSLTQFTKGYKHFGVYKSYWEAEYGIQKSEYIFDPFED